MLEIIKTTIHGAAYLLGGMSVIFLLGYLLSNYLVYFMTFIGIIYCLVCAYHIGLTMEEKEPRNRRLPK